MNRHIPVQVPHVELGARLCSVDFFYAHIALFWKDTPNTINSGYLWGGKMRGGGGIFPVLRYSELTRFLNPGHM